MDCLLASPPLRLGMQSNYELYRQLGYICINPCDSKDVKRELKLIKQFKEVCLVFFTFRADWLSYAVSKQAWKWNQPTLA